GSRRPRGSRAVRARQRGAGAGPPRCRARGWSLAGGEPGPRDPTLWVTGPHGLGYGTARFGERDRTVWGAGSHGLGSGIARFGERGRTVWGAGSHGLGRGIYAGIPAKYLVPSPL